MGVFNKTSILFCTVSLLRLVSVAAIVLAFAGELVTLVDDLTGYQSYERSLAVATPSATMTSTSINSISLGSATAASVKSSSGPGVGTVGKMRRVRKREHIASSSTTAPVASATASPLVSTNCAYVANTSVPTETGGVVFSALDRIFCCLILLLALLSEVPPPVRFTQMFWDWAFPPFGSSFGVGVLGAVQVFIGSDILSHSTNGLAMIAAWLLFVVGFLNMLFGLALGAKIKTIRSIISTPTGPQSGLKKLLTNAQPHAGSSAKGYYDVDARSAAGSNVSKATSSGKKERKPIVIGAPMAQQPAPPVYQPGGRY